MATPRNRQTNTKLNSELVVLLFTTINYIIRSTKKEIKPFYSLNGRPMRFHFNKNIIS